MRYTFRGRLCGRICAECDEPLAALKVRLYAPRSQRNLAALAVANPKDTSEILSAKASAGKSSRLLAEVETDAEGRFAVALGDDGGYDGGPFEVDVYVETVPGLRQTPKQVEPLQISITTLQPQWRETQDGSTAVWDYCLHQRFWCLVRARFGAWTICGRVLDCETQVPVAGVTVRAFDADWIQHDPLGSPAVTDGAGKFRIDYLASDFKKTPFSPGINLELIGGPDLFFTAEVGGVKVLDEPPSRGRQPDRENSGPCACVELCVEAPAPPVENPWFTHIGDFHIYGDIDPLTGRTNKSFAGHGGPDYGFFAGMKLRGFCPKTSPVGPPDPMRYRFLYEHPAAPGTQVPITGALLVPVVVGARLIQWKVFSNAFEWTFQSIVVAGAGATIDPTPQPAGPGPWGAPPAHVIVPGADGWIDVDPNALDNGFYGPLVRFNSSGAVPGGAAPGNGPGNPVAAPRNGAVIRLIFEAGPVGSPATFSNSVNRVLVNNWVEVRLLDLVQFGGGGGPCSPLSSDLDVLFTVDHELLASWQLSILSASPSAPGVVIPPLPPGATARGGSGTHHENIAAWQSCSYQVWLSSRRALTDGETDDDGDATLKTFCK